MRWRQSLHTGLVLKLTSDERQALAFLALVTAAGVAIRLVRHAEGPPGASVMAPHLSSDDLARQEALVREAERRSRPLGAGERVDVDRADVGELERLPRIGPALARRIVEDRAARGPFGRIEALDRVPGVGPGMLAVLRPHVSFSGTPRSP